MAMRQDDRPIRLGPLRHMARRMVPRFVGAHPDSGPPSRPALLTPGPTVIWHDAWVPDPLRWRLDEIKRIREWSPRTKVGAAAWACLAYLPGELAAELIDRLAACVVMESELALVKFCGLTGRRDDLGVVGYRAVTDAAVAFIADDFYDASTDVSTFDYHGLGTGTNAEDQTDTTLQTELTTEYTGNVRATGTPSNPSANVYRSVGTNTMDSGTPAVTEHGLFSASSSGTLLDRTVFSAVNLVGASGDSLQSTYSLTLTAGS